MTRRFTLPLIAFAGVTACALPEDNTLSRSDLAASVADESVARQLSFTPAADIPTGTATYAGHVRSAAIVNGEDDYDLLGQLDLEVDISATATRDGSGSVRGSITDLNLFDDNNNGFDDQALDGDLSVSGNINEGRFEANATGVLGAVLDDVIIEQTSTWSVNLSGDVRTDLEPGDVISGTVNGGTTGTASDDYDITLTGGGGFVVERD